MPKAVVVLLLALLPLLIPEGLAFTVPRGGKKDVPMPGALPGTMPDVKPFQPIKNNGAPFESREMAPDGSRFATAISGIPPVNLGMPPESQLGATGPLPPVQPAFENNKGREIVQEADNEVDMEEVAPPSLQNEQEPLDGQKPSVFVPENFEEEASYFHPHDTIDGQIPRVKHFKPVLEEGEGQGPENHSFLGHGTSQPGKQEEEEGLNMGLGQGRHELGEERTDGKITEEEEKQGKERELAQPEDANEPGARRSAGKAEAGALNDAEEEGRGGGEGKEGRIGGEGGDEAMGRDEAADANSDPDMPKSDSEQSEDDKFFRIYPFLKEASEEAVESFRALLRDQHLTKAEVEVKRREWADEQPKEVKEGFSEWKEHLDTKKRNKMNRIEEKLPTFADDTRKLYLEVKAVIKDQGISRHEECEQIRSLFNAADDALRHDFREKIHLKLVTFCLDEEEKVAASEEERKQEEEKEAGGLMGQEKEEIKKDSLDKEDSNKVGEEGQDKEEIYKEYGLKDFGRKKKLQKEEANKFDRMDTEAEMRNSPRKAFDEEIPLSDGSDDLEQNHVHSRAAEHNGLGMEPPFKQPVNEEAALTGKDEATEGKGKKPKEDGEEEEMEGVQEPDGQGDEEDVQLDQEEYGQAEDKDGFETERPTGPFAKESVKEPPMSPSTANGPVKAPMPSFSKMGAPRASSDRMGAPMRSFGKMGAPSMH